MLHFIFTIIQHQDIIVLIYVNLITAYSNASYLLAVLLLYNDIDYCNELLIKMFLSKLKKIYLI